MTNAEPPIKLNFPPVLKQPGYQVAKEKVPIPKSLKEIIKW